MALLIVHPSSYSNGSLLIVIISTLCIIYFLSIQSIVFSSQQVNSPKKLFIGNYRCNQYGNFGIAPQLVPNAEPFQYIPNTSMATCKIENLCLTSKGEFVLFESFDRIGPNVENLNSKPWVYVQGSTVNSKRGNLYIKLVDGDLMLKYEGKDVTSAYVVRTSSKNPSVTSDSASSSEKILANHLEKVPTIPIEIAKDFQLYKKPVYALKRYHAANRTHLLSEMLPMIMGLMTNFRPDSSQKTHLEKNHILFLDNLYDMTTSNSNWLGTFNQSVEIATRDSIASASLLSTNPILQMCFENGVWKVDKAPCEIFKTFQTPPVPAFDVPPQESSSQTSSSTNQEGLSTQNSPNDASNEIQSPITLQACFSNIHMGHSISNLLLYPYGKEGLFMELRELVYKNLKIFPYNGHKFTNSKELEELEFQYALRKPIVIGIVKSTNLNKDLPTITISNVDYLVSFLQRYLPQEAFIGKRLLSNTGHYKKSLEIQVLDDNEMDIPSLVKTMSTIDVLISDPLNSIAYFSMFMRRETVLFLTPSCNRQQQPQPSIMTSNAFYRLSALPNVQVVDMFEFFGEKSFHIRQQAMNDCQIQLPDEELYLAIAKALRKRYRKLME